MCSQLAARLACSLLAARLACSQLAARLAWIPSFVELLAIGLCHGTGSSFVVIATQQTTLGSAVITSLAGRYATPLSWNEVQLSGDCYAADHGELSGDHFVGGPLCDGPGIILDER